MNVDANVITVNGVRYIPEGSAASAPIPGKRAVLVIDRGWVFAGDVERKDGRIYLTRAVLVQSWSEIGFDGMLADPRSGKVRIKKLPTTVDFPADAELFAAPVGDSWGL